MRKIQCCPCRIGQGACRLGIGAHCQKHPPHICMINNADTLALIAGKGKALRALPRVTDCLLVGTITDRHTLQPDSNPGIVHHNEHIFQALALFPNKKARGTALIAKLHHTCGRAMNSQFMFKRDRIQIISLPQTAIIIHQNLRYNKQAKTFIPRWQPLDMRQNKVYDILGKIMIAISDKNLLSGNQVMIALFFCGTANGRQIGAGLWFGQVHCSCPLAANQFLKIQCLLRCIPMCFNRLDCSLCQQRAQPQG